MEPRIESARVRLAGVQGVIRVDSDLVPDLRRLYDRLFEQVDEIENVSRAQRTICHWHFVDQDTKLCFVGVEVTTLADFTWDYERGLAAWDLGETTWAIWQERNGQEGTITHCGVCWEWLTGSAYTFDARFLGDFEVHYWKRFGRDTRSAFHEIWIPVVARERS